MSFSQLRTLRSQLGLLSLPTVTTQSATSVTASQADGNGTVVNNGGSATTTRGFCWSTNPQPTTSDSTITTGSGVGAFTATMTGLASSTVYYYRAFATNAIGTGYGEQITFTTSSGGGAISYSPLAMMMGMGS